VKSRNPPLAPIALLVFGGLLIVGALAIFALDPGMPTPTPTLPPQELAPIDDGTPRVSVGDAKAAYDLKQAVFVDVRGVAFWEQGHIPGAISIPLEEIESRQGELSQGDWIITYCT
jgi:3-mercaptopyruvate sulfurtransferase SseA